MADRTVPELVAAARGGELRATARLLTLVERGGEMADRVAGVLGPGAPADEVVACVRAAAASRGR